MKAEHRHELKTNDLAKSLITFQDYVKQYGGRVALGIAIVILAIVLINQRMNRTRDLAFKYRQDLATARSIIDNLTHSQVDMFGRPAPKPLDADKVPAMLRDVRDNSSEKPLQAEALFLMGEFSWAMANYPETSAATTQSVNKSEKDRAEYLKDAKSAYQQVLDQYADQTLAAVSARFGLGAIAENERNWDEAKKQYEAAKAIPGAGNGFKTRADKQIKQLDQIRQPVLIGQVPEHFELPPLPSTTQTTTTQSTTTATSRTATATTKPAK